MIRILIDISSGTNEEIEELNKLVPYGQQKINFDRSNIKVDLITKEDAEIAKANNVNIENALCKNIILGCHLQNQGDIKWKKEF